MIKSNILSLPEQPPTLMVGTTIMGRGIQIDIVSVYIYLYVSLVRAYENIGTNVGLPNLNCKSQIVAGVVAKSNLWVRDIDGDL